MTVGGQGKWKYFPTGRSDMPIAPRLAETTFLGLEPIPALSEIAAIPEFEPVAITKDEFEAVWLNATEKCFES